ncbi:MAG: helix-turn-helix transcriptional regulator [Actinomycetota bacterium]|nr:helix-turn-helix transcriptional regulator [Actinomycetota bacterium]
MKSYGQYCGLAKALDHVGDRWTLLIVRELLIGPRRYSELRAALPGIATNLLASRLRGLAADGIVRRDESVAAYELTEFGRGLEPIVHGLVRWGGRWMVERAPGEDFHPEWLVIALAALLPRRRRGRVAIHVDGTVVSIDGGRVRVGELADPQATVEGAPEAILGVAAGELPLSAVRIRGDRAVAKSILRP